MQLTNNSQEPLISVFALLLGILLRHFADSNLESLPRT